MVVLASTAKQTAALHAVPLFAVVWSAYDSRRAVQFGLAVIGHIHPFTMAKGFVIGLAIAIVAPLGDLCESMVKRDIGLKDMGAALPGHGGLTDRFDGLLFALPTTYYLIQLLHVGGL